MSTPDPADQRMFEVDEERWEQFIAAVSRAAEYSPGLAEFLSEESPFEAKEDHPK